MAAKDTKIRFNHLLGNIFKDKRVALKLTQERAAEQSEVSTKEYGRIERGEVATDLYTVIKICEALKVDVLEVISSVREKRDW